MKAPPVAALLLLVGCANLDGFFFNPTPVDEYDWNSADPNLDGELTDPHPSLVGDADRFEGFVDLADRRVHYVYARRPGATETLFYSHGNAHNLGRYWDRVELLWQQGYNVMIYDYPGYGRSTGEPDEASMYGNAQAVFDLLPSMPGVDAGRIWLYGFSLGGAPTYEMAVRETTCGVITESTFCSAEALVQDGTFLDLPGSFLTDFSLDNCGKIAQLDEPVLLLHGTADTFMVPRHAEMLHRAEPSSTLHWVPGAEHSDLPLVAGDDYLGWVNDFLSAPCP